MLGGMVWGDGGKMVSAEDRAARRRALAQQLDRGVDTSPVGHWTQGAARVANALFGAMGERKLAAEQEEADKSGMAALTGLMGGGGFPAMASVGGAPVATGSATGSGATGAAPRASRGGPIDPSIRDGIASTASALGIDPVDLATAISYETAGTFDPKKRGPTTQWGQHKGLIQFGQPQAKQHGVDWNDPVGSQLGPNGAVASYLRSTGVRPGMGLLDIYSAINAGGVGRYNRTDANNGGAPGTVRDKVEQQMAGHRARALAMFQQSQAPNMPAVSPGNGAAPLPLARQQAETAQMPMAGPQSNEGLAQDGAGELQAGGSGMMAEPAVYRDQLNNVPTGDLMQRSPMPEIPAGMDVSSLITPASQPSVAQGFAPSPDQAPPMAQEAGINPAASVAPSRDTVPLPSEPVMQQPAPMMQPQRPMAMGFNPAMGGENGITPQMFADAEFAAREGRPVPGMMPQGQAQAAPAMSPVQSVAAAMPQGGAQMATQAPEQPSPVQRVAGAMPPGDRLAQLATIAANPSISPQIRTVAATMWQKESERMNRDPNETRLKQLQVQQAEAAAANAPLTRRQLELQNQKAERDLSGEGSRPLTPQERQQFGIAPNQAAAWDTRKNAPVILGGSATTVNIGQDGQPLGNPGDGLVWQRTQDGKIAYDERGAPIAIPFQGGKRFDETKKGADAKAEQVRQKQQQGDMITQDIDRIFGLLDNAFIPATGGIGALASKVPGTNAADAARLLDGIKANIGFDKLAEMRAASPTGAALGSVTEKELQFLQSVVGSLEQSQTDGQFRFNLARLKNSYLDVIHGLGKGPVREKLPELPQRLNSPNQPEAPRNAPASGSPAPKLSDPLGIR